MQPTCLHLRHLAEIGVTISRSHDQSIVLIKLCIDSNFFLLNLIWKKIGVGGRISRKISPPREKSFSIYCEKWPPTLPLWMTLWAVVMPAAGLYDRVCEMWLEWKGSSLLPLIESLRKGGGGAGEVGCIPNASKNESSWMEKLKDCETLQEGH